MRVTSNLWRMLNRAVLVAGYRTWAKPNNQVAFCAAASKLDARPRQKRFCSLRDERHGFDAMMP